MYVDFRKGTEQQNSLVNMSDSQLKGCMINNFIMKTRNIMQ